MYQGAEMRQVPLADLLKLGIDSLFLFVIIDVEGFIRHISSAYATILGIPVERIIGRPIKEVIPTTGLDKVIETGKDEIGSLFVLKNGTPVICNRLAIRDEKGQIIGALSMALFHNLDQVSQLTLKIEQLQKENELYQQHLAALKQTAFSLDSIVGNSPEIFKIKSIIKRTADSNLCVLFTGETGTGKEVFANAIHHLSPPRFGSFVKINCAAIPNELFESELFGYEGGAFSGASKGGKPGKFEEANNGTLLLDEIGELPLQFQAKLLRVLQEQKIERVGSNKTISLDIRIVCCTNQKLETLIDTHHFRRDLYYRINTVEIAIPPLRERIADIPLLCAHLIKKINQTHGCFIEGVSKTMLHHFASYSWPGNVRELEHILEQACVMNLSGILDEDHFEFFLSRIYRNNMAISGSMLDSTVESIEKEAILKALQKTQGNKSHAAEMLNISRSRLYDRLKKYNLNTRINYAVNSKITEP
jgi:transcriptional regulator with PAS, ATPase and Fis domain